MLDPWLPILALAATLLPLLGAKRWITRRLQELSMRWVGDPDVALILYFVLVLPGVVIHELSHWLTARALGVRVTKFTLGPVRKGRSRRVSLGSIRVGKVDAVRASIIGVAPLMGGSAVILLIGTLVLGVDEMASAMAGQGVDGLAAGLGQVARTPDFALWLYLIFAVSNAMLPSDSDMATVRPLSGPCSGSHIGSRRRAAGPAPGLGQRRCHRQLPGLRLWVDPGRRCGVHARHRAAACHHPLVAESADLHHRVGRAHRAQDTGFPGRSRRIHLAGQPLTRLPSTGQ
jgi:hypothetical protein